MTTNKPSVKISDYTSDFEIDLGDLISDDDGKRIGQVIGYDLTDQTARVTIDWNYIDSSTQTHEDKKFKLKEELLDDEDMKNKLQTMSLLGMWRDVLGEPNLTIDDLSDRELQVFNFQKNVLRKYQDELQEK